MSDFERRLYAAVQVRELDRRAIQDHGIPGYTLMQRAAAAAWNAARERWPLLRSVAVLAGGGNNGGDGYEIARLALAAGCTVRLCEVGDQTRRGDAATARAAWLRQGTAERFDEIDAGFFRADLIVDAIFGTGLSRPPEDAALAAIKAINGARSGGAAVLAVDLPSGLQSDTGAAPGAAVQADLTVTFIGRKLGLYTGQGPALCGRIVFDPLGVADTVGQGLPPRASLLDAAELRGWLPRRPRTAHKGDHGHVLVVGGDAGTIGAVLLAARAALRAGAGLVSVATRGAHAALLTAAQPEIMCRGVESAAELQTLIGRADVIAIGPGLGQGEWGRMACNEAFAAGKPLLADADALNLLAHEPRRHERWVLTPHPGEAGRLLGLSTAEIQADRPAAALELCTRYGGVAVLKGAGTLVQGDALALCPYGNPGMGVGGMGDALSGIIAAFIGQGLELESAARAGVLAHALAGDRAAADGERGLSPSDLIGELRAVVNP
jgi:ADP-dependent NAD(P)H-hydrate dehydratase / NAD(P)H-hydrate epimerase